MAVTPNMIAVALGVAAPPTGSPKLEQWSMWIADAAMLIDARREALGIVEALDAAKLDYVVREAVKEHALRPDSATQVTTSVDDGSVSRTYSSSAGRITIRDEWWTLLGLTVASGAFSIDTVGSVSAHLPWCASMFGAFYCSCGVDIAGVPIFEGGAG